MGDSATKIGHYDSLDEFIEHFPLRPPVLLMVENDPEVIDLDFWLDIYRRVHADMITLAAGGYVAYYPTQIPYHHRSKFLDRHGDLFGTLVRRCRELGMKYIIARTDPHAVHQEAYEAHPEWVAVDRLGNKRRHWVYPNVWVTCPLGPYNFEFMNQVNKEIISLYDIDFIFSNRWAGDGSGICYCESCRRLFHEATGLDLPAEADRNDPIYIRYIEWREKRLFELAHFWDDEIRAIKPGARFIPNSGGGALSSLDMVELSKMVPFLIADRQARPENSPAWMNGKNAKEFRATMGRKPVLAGVNLGVCGKYRWMDSVKSQAEYRIWQAEATANGMIARFSKHSGVVYDRRWVPTTVEFFQWEYENERYLRNVEPLADVAIVYSQQTARNYGRCKAQHKVEDPILGVYQALIEARIPFEMVHDQLLDAEHVDKFRALILPNIAALSDRQCQQLREFVGRGGSILATLETSLYDERGQRRPDFGLSDLFGVSVAGELQGPVRNSYLNIEANADGSYHPLVRGLEDAGRIINGTYRLPVRATVPFPVRPVTLVPPYPDLPMEELYPRQPRTDIPEVYMREMGPSRIVYFPWDIDRVFWEVLHSDHLKLLTNAVRWICRDQAPAQVTGPGVLDVTVWRQKGSLTVHMVNLTNAMMMRGEFREFLPVGEQTVRIRLPERCGVAGVRLLRAGTRPEAAIQDGLLTVKVPSITDYEVVAVDLA